MLNTTTKQNILINMIDETGKNNTNTSSPYEGAMGEDYTENTPCPYEGAMGTDTPVGEITHDDKYVHSEWKGTHIIFGDNGEDTSVGEITHDDKYVHSEWKGTHIIFEDNGYNEPAHVVLTPMNLVNPRSSYAQIGRDHYLKESLLFAGDNEEDGSLPEWDSTKHNTAVIGDKFGFVHNTSNIVELFRIVNILPVSARKVAWKNDMPGERGREILILSRRVETISWSRLKHALEIKGGNCQNTYRSRNKY